jgi:chemotaxis protein methyltransferase CheR
VYRTAHISFVGAPVTKRPRRLFQYSRSHAASEPTEPIAPFIEWVFKSANLDSSMYRPASLNRRLKACLRRLRVPSPESARKLIEAQPELLNPALDTLLLGVSEFFRDPAVFETLRETIVPELLQRNEHLRIASFGVSEGHELYSLAMLLAEAGALHRCDLTGIDVRPDAIARAQQGSYNERDLGGVSSTLLHKYFEPNGGRWTVNSNVRDRVQWKVGNVLQLDEVSQYEIILFRNVALYLTPAHVFCAWSLLFGQLKENGVLVCGKADHPPASLPLSRVAPCIYQKHAA